MKNAVKLAFCGITTALSVILLFLGGITYVLAYTMPMITGLLMIMLRRIFGKSGALITYTATSILSFILVADKECMLMYTMFFGFYPIILEDINKIKPAVVRWLVKLLLFNAAIGAVELILFYVFGIPFSEGDETAVFVIAFVLLMNVLLVIYDTLVSRLIRLYTVKLEKRIKKYFKQ
ncbi:MAG: hypothetical protein NC397_07970 [Clostridium sp.]|nr:hypothetical protein [Clostridium sp.]